IIVDIDFPVGADVMQHLEQAVKECDFLLVIIGSAWLNIRSHDGKRRLDDSQDFVRFEIRTALEAGIKVIPVLVMNAQMPQPHELPDVLQELAYRQAFTVGENPDFHPDINRVIKSIGGDSSRTMGTSIRKQRTQSSSQSIKTEPKSPVLNIPARTLPTSKRRIFISYKSDDKDIVHHMAEMIQKWDNVETVWIDEHGIEEGEAWWDKILTGLEQSDLFLVALSNLYLESVACQREYTYAVALGKALLPVVVKPVDYNRVPSELAQIQYVNFEKNNEETQVRLYNGINKTSESVTMPATMPPRPPVPMTKLKEVEKLLRKARLSDEDERTIAFLLEDIIDAGKLDEVQSALHTIDMIQRRTNITKGFDSKLNRRREAAQQRLNELNKSSSLTDKSNGSSLFGRWFGS
ncbi:MAG: toll/interleukin-1 receptor domain-containing protein, partial [Chloroflexota bacterium]